MAPKSKKMFTSTQGRVIRRVPRRHLTWLVVVLGQAGEVKFACYMWEGYMTATRPKRVQTDTRDTRVMRALAGRVQRIARLKARLHLDQTV